MPWEIKEADGKFCVHKKDDTKPIKCYRNKGRAEAYMRALYANSPDAKATLEFTGNFVTFDLSASEQDPRFLVFRNAILARAEVNANNDELFPEGIDELAKTLPGCPINDEHSEDFVGVFTAGRKTDDNALSTDGVIWANRWADLVELIKQGRKGLSVEANAQKIKCTKCGQEFEPGDGKTCAHIISTRAKRLYNARRQLHGMTAQGGATVLAPAGTGARFGNELYMVANQGSDVNLICGYCEEDVIPSEDGTCPHCGINVEAEITKRKDVSEADKKRAEKEYGDVKYADEKNKKYPIDTEEHIRAAWNYINKAKNAAKYEDGGAAVKRAIVSAWKSKISKEGPPSAHEEKAAMDPKKDMTKETPEEEKKENPEEEKKETPEEEKAEASLKAEIEKLKAALDEATKKLAEAEKAKSELEARYTSKVLASVFADEELKTAVEKAKGMTLDQIDLVASVAGKSGKAGKSNLSHLDLSGAAGNGTQPTKEKLTL